MGTETRAARIQSQTSWTCAEVEMKTSKTKRSARVRQTPGSMWSRSGANTAKGERNVIVIYGKRLEQIFARSVAYGCKAVTEAHFQALPQASELHPVEHNWRLEDETGSIKVEYLTDAKFSCPNLH
eukprot:3825005-Amphidinium_carterae.2